jgi:hypothetical protein
MSKVYLGNVCEMLEICLRNIKNDFYSTFTQNNASDIIKISTMQSIQKVGD